MLFFVIIIFCLLKYTCYSSITYNSYVLERKQECTVSTTTAAATAIVDSIP